MVAGLAVVAVVALLLVPDRLGLDDVFPVVGFVLIRAPATLAVVVLALLALAVRARWWPTVTAVLLVAAVAVVSLLPRVVPDDGGPDAGPDLLVLSLNVDRGGADVPALAAVIRDRRPDVVVLPEAGEAFRARLAARVADLGYRSWASTPPDEADVDGTAMFAAPSLGDVRAETLRVGRFPWLELTGGALGPTRVVGVHLVAPVPGLVDAWPGELAALSRWCGGPDPAVVAGDLNATLDVRAMRAGTAGCADAGEVAGAGLLATWPVATPRWLGAQIDHVLATGGVGLSGFDVTEVPGTDHRGLLVTVHARS